MNEVVINDNDTDKIGSIQISEEVISTIAGTACFEVDDVIGMPGSTSVMDFISKKHLAKGVAINMTEEGIEVEVSVVLKLGSRIAKVADKIQDKVKTAIESMTNLTVKRVNVNIIDLREVA